MLTYFTRVFIVFTLSFLIGCTTLSDLTLARRSSIDKEIAVARADTEAKLKSLSAQQVSLLQQVANEQQSRAQSAADHLFKGSVVFSGLKSPTRPEMVMGQSIQQTASQLPPATPAAQVTAFKALQTELDETKISTEALKTQYETELGKARAEGAAKDKALTDLANSLKKVEADKVTVLTKAQQVEAELSDKRKVADDAIIAAKTKEADDAKALQALKTRFSAITGILTLLCVAGAIYSPVFKRQLGIGAVVLGIITAAIWYIEPYMVAIVIGATLVGLAAWMVRNHYVESKAANATYHALQSVKDTAREEYDRVIKPALQTWHTKYLKDGTTVPDPSITTHIDQRLMETGAK